MNARRALALLPNLELLPIKQPTSSKWAGSQRWLFPFSIFHDSRSPTNYPWPQLDRWSRANLRPQNYYPSLISSCVNHLDAKVNCGLLLGAMVTQEMSWKACVEVSGFGYCPLPPAKVPGPQVGCKRREGGKRPQTFSKVAAFYCCTFYPVKA